MPPPSASPKASAVCTGASKQSPDSSVKSLLLTNEYPPHVYGGAGVHVEFLSRELSKLMDVEVRCFGDQRIDQPHLRVRGYPEPEPASAPSNLRPVFGAMSRNVASA